MFNLKGYEVASEDNFYVAYEFVAAGGGPAGRFMIDQCWGCPPPFDNGTGFSISADFAGVGSETYTLEVWNHDTLVYSAPGKSGLAGYVSDFPDVVGKLGGEMPCGLKCWPDGSDILIPETGQVFEMTEIRMVCEGVDGPGDLLDAVQFTTFGVQELTFVDVATVLAESPVSCPPDLNGDDILDFFDILIFVGWFSGSDSRADWNEDGLIDFFDVIAYVGEFSAGCP